jgi:protein-S-isoprenylcysteine O-methyltransferase Ste14
MSETQTLIDYGPLVLVAVAGIWNLVRIAWLERAKGVSVLATLKRRKTPTEWGLGTIAAGLTGYLLLRPFVPMLDAWVFAQPSSAPLVGLGVMAGGITLMIAAQMNMGQAWRIGVPETVEDTQSLITDGLHSLSRNPIYLGVMIYLVGTAVMLPSPLTLFAATATFWLVQQLIRSEEAFMEATFGEDFRRYKQRVRRWI